MKKILSAILIGIIFFAGVSAVFAFGYVGNMNTKRFHRPDCRSVNEMHPNNKTPIGSREEAIAAGYVPCKRCKP